MAEHIKNEESLPETESAWIQDCSGHDRRTEKAGRELIVSRHKNDDRSLDGCKRNKIRNALTFVAGIPRALPPCRAHKDHEHNKLWFGMVEKI
jgi:hypothetical protein